MGFKRIFNAINVNIMTDLVENNINFLGSLNVFFHELFRFCCSKCNIL